MKTFINYLTESKDRFIKSNKNLSKDQKKELIKFFKMNRQAEKEVNWQKAKNMTYDDFFNIKMKFKSGRKTQKFKLKNISGQSEGNDYFYIRTSSDSHECFMPLSFDASVEIASKKYGGVRGKWCVADESDGGSYWKDYTVNGEVFVFVITNDDKWAVHIGARRKNFDVWDKHDNFYSKKSQPFKNEEIIPGFSIKDELMKSKLKKVYDKGSEMIEMRYEEDEHEQMQRQADEESTQLIGDVIDLAQGVIDNYEDYEKNMTEYLNDLIDFWKAKEEDDTKALNDLITRLNKVNEVMNRMDDDFDSAEYDNQLLTKVELTILRDRLERGVEHAQEVYDEWNYEEAHRELQEIKKDGIPLDEDMHDEFVERTDDYNLKEFGLANTNDWTDVYDENHDSLNINDRYGGSDYDTFFNNAYEQWGGDISGLIKDLTEYISSAHSEPNSHTWEKRKTPIHRDDISNILSDNDMY